MSIGRNVQDKKFEPHVKKNYKRKTNRTAQVAHMTQMLIMSLSTTNVGAMTELHQGIMSKMAEAPVPSSGGSSSGEGS